ncbi:MAG: glycosyl transferase family 28 [Deltaproteobacteria bacterium]|nr:glycosyl transferase family 28 [Deltaproteobacteria bacterium]
MIFVTVGTTIWFDDLIETIDQLVASEQIHEPVVCQIGNGRYIPKNCEYFRFQKSIDEWIQRSSVVISHGGTGTVLSLLVMQKPFVAVANPMGADDHQSQFLERLERTGCVLWCRNLEDLPHFIHKADAFKSRLLGTEHLADDIKAFLDLADDIKAFLES